MTEARSEALAQAKEIHTFDRDAADTKERVQVQFEIHTILHTVQPLRNSVLDSLYQLASYHVVLQTLRCEGEHLFHTI